LRLSRREVGNDERIGELPGDDRLGHNLTLGRPRGGCRLGDGDRLVLELRTCGGQHLALELDGTFGHDSVLAEQCHQRGVAGGRPGEDRSDAVQPLEQLGSLRLADRLVRTCAGTFFSREQGDRLELGTKSRRHTAVLRSGLDLAYGSGEHGHDVLGPAGTPLTLTALAA
jgi:hypothetical protein